MQFSIPEDLGSGVSVDVFVGERKESCDIKVMHSSVLDECVPNLGRFLKFQVAKPNTSITIDNLEDNTLADRSQSAFNFLVATAKKSDYLPPVYPSPDRNDKKLFNDIVKWPKSLRLGWITQMDADSSGKSFVMALRDALWLIDGHWKTLMQRRCEVPDTLMRQFPESYNRPEKWKGRKKTIVSFICNSDKLRIVQEGVFCQTTKAFMKKLSWKPVFELVLKLADALRKYLDYLEPK